MLSQDSRAFHDFDLQRAYDCADAYASDEPEADIQGARAGAEWMSALVRELGMAPGEDIQPEEDHVLLSAQEDGGVTLDDAAVAGAVAWLLGECR